MLRLDRLVLVCLVAGDLGALVPAHASPPKRRYRAYDPQSQREVVKELDHAPAMGRIPVRWTNGASETMREITRVIAQPAQGGAPAAKTQLAVTPELAFSEIVGTVGRSGVILDPKAPDRRTARFSRQVNGLMRRMLPWLDARLGKHPGMDGVVDAVHTVAALCAYDLVLMPEYAVRYRRQLIGRMAPKLKEATVGGLALLESQLQLIDAVGRNAPMFGRRPAPGGDGLRQTAQLLQDPTQLLQSVLIDPFNKERLERLAAEAGRLHGADETHMYLGRNIGWLADINERRAAYPGMPDIFASGESVGGLLDRLLSVEAMLGVVRKWIAQAGGPLVQPPGVGPVPPINN